MTDTNANSMGGEGARRTVLIVEDDAFLRTMYSFLLEQEGFSVLAAEDGPGALELATVHRGRIQLLIADYTLPGMGGLETWQQMSAAGSAPDVLFLSGDPHAVHVALRESGLHWPVLAKPFHPDAFVGIVHALVGPAVAPVSG